MIVLLDRWKVLAHPRAPNRHPSVGNDHVAGSVGWKVHKVLLWLADGLAAGNVL
jgi:hypothetical protein